MSGTDNFELAVSDFLKADKKTDTAPIFKHKVRFNLGIVYRRLGRFQESIEILNKATTMDFAKAATSNNIGLSYFDSK
jgi:Flp pilus assembly protein TadD